MILENKLDDRRKVKVITTDYGVSLSVTENGWQWTELTGLGEETLNLIKETIAECQAIIKEASE